MSAAQGTRGGPVSARTPADKAAQRASATSLHSLRPQHLCAESMVTGVAAVRSFTIFHPKSLAAHANTGRRGVARPKRRERDGNTCPGKSSVPVRGRELHA